MKLEQNGFLRMQNILVKNLIFHKLSHSIKILEKRHRVLKLDGILSFSDHL